VLHRKDANRLARAHSADGIRHMQSGALLANDDGTNVGLGGCLDDRIDGIADQKFDALTFQDLGHGRGSFHMSQSMALRGD
jgi:hypothetical protein